MAAPSACGARPVWSATKLRLPYSQCCGRGVQSVATTSARAKSASGHGQLRVPLLLLGAGALLNSQIQILRHWCSRRSASTQPGAGPPDVSTTCICGERSTIPADFNTGASNEAIYLHRSSCAAHHTAVAQAIADTVQQRREALRKGLTDLADEPTPLSFFTVRKIVSSE